MTAAAQVLAWMAFAFAVGSIPFGVLIGRLKGVDPRSGGSGNIGATNVLRLLGVGPGLTVLALDMLKGFSPVWMATHVSLGAQPAGQSALGTWLPVVIGVCAVLGHAFSPFLGFRGGKSVATAGGVVAALDARAVVLLLIVFFVTLALTRYVSIASTVVAIGVPVAMAGFGRPASYVAFGILAAVFVVYKHRSNYARLRHGNENRFSLRPTARPRPAEDPPAQVQQEDPS